MPYISTKTLPSAKYARPVGRRDKVRDSGETLNKQALSQRDLINPSGLAYSTLGYTGINKNIGHDAAG